MKTKGKFFWKQTWFSYCSRHQEYDSECKLCNSGRWSYNWLAAISAFCYKYFYGSTIDISFYCWKILLVQ